MNHFPSMMAFVGELHREKTMNSYDDVNRILDEMAEQGILEPMVEPIDDPSIQTDFYDWAEVVGVTEEIEPDSFFFVEG